jgi:hypothetical protein
VSCQSSRNLPGPFSVGPDLIVQRSDLGARCETPPGISHSGAVKTAPLFNFWYLSVETGLHPFLGSFASTKQIDYNSITYVHY